MSSMIESSRIESTIDCSVPAADGDFLPAAFLVQVHPVNMKGPIKLDVEVVLGRSSECDIQVDDDSASRQHAKIQRTNSGYEMVDLDSTNGTQINNQDCQQHELEPGDRVQLGTHIFQFLDEEDFESQYEETIYKMVTRDGLTETYNRRYLFEYLEREISRCKRYSRQISVAIICIEEFESLSDEHGTLIADDVLLEFSKRLRDILRNDEVLARYDDMKFAIIMPETRFHHARKVAERCCQAIDSAPFDTQVGTLSITTGSGVASPNPTAMTTPEDLMQKAVRRLYESKE